jgi:hypothetical protein
MSDTDRTVAAVTGAELYDPTPMNFGAPGARRWSVEFSASGITARAV